jgi:hypothetical protein
MTNFEINKEEKEELWSSFGYNSGMSLSGMKKIHNNSGQ